MKSPSPEPHPETPLTSTILTDAATSAAPWPQLPALTSPTIPHWTSLYLLAYAEHMLKKGPSSERHVRVFRNGRNQAVRIPREFELPGANAIMRKEGQRLIIEPAPAKSLRAVLAGLQPLREKFPRMPDSPAGPVDL